MSQGWAAHQSQSVTESRTRCRHRETACGAHRECCAIGAGDRGHLIHWQGEALSGCSAHAVAGFDRDWIAARCSCRRCPAYVAVPFAIVFECHRGWAAHQSQSMTESEIPFRHHELPRGADRKGRAIGAGDRGGVPPARLLLV